MTDIVEQAARVLSTQTTCDGEPHPTEVHRRQAQALADAGLLAEPARTVPTREELVEAVSDIDAESWPNPASTEEIADAILALLAEQPTVAEVKAAALEEFAAHIENTAQRDDVRLTEHAVNDAGGAYLAREQAHEIKDRK